MNKSSVLIATLLFVVSCSKIKELDKRTEKMENSTEQMSKTTDEMRDTTGTMYQQLRSKDAEETRDRQFRALLENKDGMGGRIKDAGIYFKAFEFQLWTGKGNDTQRHREALLLDAANEFVRSITDIYDGLNLKSMSPTKKEVNAMSFYALAASMHSLSTFQEELVAANPKIKPISFYDIIKSALLKDNNNQPLKAYEEVLVSGMNKEIMIELVKARVDIIGALALRDLTDQREMTFGQKTKAAIFKMSFGTLGSIDLPQVYEKSNNSTKSEIEKRLDAANNAKSFLKEIGVIKSLEKTLKSAYTSIDLNSSSNNKGQKEEKIDEKRENIKSLINTLLE